jgi:hypothetical protein
MTKRLNEQVKRNIDRFPDTFMFQLTKAEFDGLKSHFATSSWGGRRKHRGNKSLCAVVANAGVERGTGPKTGDDREEVQRAV